MPPEMTSESALASQILVIVGQKPTPVCPRSRRKSCSTRRRASSSSTAPRRWASPAISKLVKEDLAGRVRIAFDGLRAAIARSELPSGKGVNGSNHADDATSPRSRQSSTSARLDEAPTPHHIPWSYGHNRVTAMVVDPERDVRLLGVHRRRGRHRARRGLGPAGANAWLNLRIYDITGRLFDGTNAHSYFDHTDRAHRPAVVLRHRQADLGRVRRARAQIGRGLLRQDHPLGARRVPAPRAARRSNHVEWLTVRASGESSTAGQRQRGRGGGGAAGGGRRVRRQARRPQRGLHGLPEWERLDGALRRLRPGRAGGTARFERRWEWQRAWGRRRTWTGERTQIEWIGPLIRSAWEAGPFTYAVQSPAYIENGDEGDDDRAHGARPGPHRLRPLAGRDPRHRRARRAAGAGDLGDPPQLGHHRRHRARRDALAGARARQLGVGGARAAASAPGWAAASCGSAAPASCSWSAPASCGSAAPARRVASEWYTRRERAADARRQRVDVRGAPANGCFAGASERHLRGRQRAADARAPASALFAGASERLLGGASERLFARSRTE